MGPRAETPTGPVFWRRAMGWVAQWVTLWVIQRAHQRFKQQVFISSSAGPQWAILWGVQRVLHRATGMAGRGWPDTVNQRRQPGARQTPGASPPQGQRHRGCGCSWTCQSVPPMKRKLRWPGGPSCKPEKEPVVHSPPSLAESSRFHAGDTQWRCKWSSEGMSSVTNSMVPASQATAASSHAPASDKPVPLVDTKSSALGSA